MQLRALLRNGTELSLPFSIASALFLSPRGWYPLYLLLWEEADPDIPVLISAKAEYAKLQQAILHQILTKLSGLAASCKRISTMRSAALPSQRGGMRPALLFPVRMSCAAVRI